MVPWDVPTPESDLLHQLLLCGFRHCSSQWHCTFQANSMNAGYHRTSYQLEISSHIPDDSEPRTILNPAHTKLFLYVNAHSVHTSCCSYMNTPTVCKHVAPIWMHTPCCSYLHTPTLGTYHMPCIYTCTLCIHRAGPICTYSLCVHTMIFLSVHNHLCAQTMQILYVTTQSLNNR